MAEQNTVSKDTAESVKDEQPKKDPTITSELETKEPNVTVVSKEEVKEKEQKVEVVTPRGPSFQIKYPQEQKKYIKMLIYGAFGVGKTYLAGTSQDVKEMTNVINIDVEGGNKVLDVRGDIPTIPIRDYNKLADAFEYLKAHCLFRDNNDVDHLKEIEAWFRGIDIKSIKKPTIFNTVMIDSLSEVARYCMYKLMGVDIEKTRLDQIPVSPEYAEWNRRQEMIMLLVRKFRDLPMHVIFVCSSQWDKDEMNRMLYTPNIQGKLANEIQGFVDHVGYYTSEINTETKETHRYLMLQPGRTYQAKNRFVNFKDQYLVDPIMQDIYDLEVLNKSVPVRLAQ